MVTFHPRPALCRRTDPPARPRRPFAPLLAALIALAAQSVLAQAQAQPAARSPRPDPLDPQASVPPLRYLSSLRPEGRSAAAPPIAWREANDAVARIGGWRVYAREAQQPDPAPEPAPAPPAAPSAVRSGPGPLATQPPAGPAAPAGQPVQPAQPGHHGHQGHQGDQGHKRP